LFDQIWIFLAHILRVAAEHANSAIGKLVHLCSFTVVFVLAGESLALEAI
jgi:hypothetical protein